MNYLSGFNLNSYLDNKGMDKIDPHVMGSLIGFNFHYNRLYIDNSYFIGFQSLNKNNRFHQGSIDLSVNYELLQSNNGSLFVGLAGQVMFNKAAISNGVDYDFEQDDSGIGELYVQHQQIAIGPKLRYGFPRSSYRLPSLELSYMFHLKQNEWQSKSVKLSNAPMDGVNCLSIKVVYNLFEIK